MKIKQREMVECLGKGGGQMRRPNAEAVGFPHKKKRGCGGETPIYKIEILFPKKVMSTPFAIKRKTENDSSSSTLR